MSGREADMYRTLLANFPYDSHIILKGLVKTISKIVDEGNYFYEVRIPKTLMDEGCPSIMFLNSVNKVIYVLDRSTIDLKDFTFNYRVDLITPNKEYRDDF